jgi:aldehyde dehydrogenase (NAD+)
VIDQSQLDTDLEYIEIGRKGSRQAAVRRAPADGGDFDKGYFLEPTIFGGVTQQMRIAQEEIFGTRCWR